MDGAGCTHIFRNVYMYTYMHLATANEKEAMSLKEPWKGCMGGFGQREITYCINLEVRERKQKASIRTHQYLSGT